MAHQPRLVVVDLLFRAAGVTESGFVMFSFSPPRCGCPATHWEHIDAVTPRRLRGSLSLSPPLRRFLRESARTASATVARRGWMPSTFTIFGSSVHLRPHDHGVCPTYGPLHRQLSAVWLRPPEAVRHSPCRRTAAEPPVGIPRELALCGSRTGRVPERG
jgi:hypothetical protein